MTIVAVNFSQRGAMSSSCGPGWLRRPSLGRRIVPELFDDAAVGSVSHSLPRFPVGRSGSNFSTLGLGGWV